MLRAVFVWLDDHPHSYWIVAGASTFLLFFRIALSWRREQRRPAAGATSAIWGDALLLFLFLLAWRWPFLLSSVEFNPDESQLIAGAITLNHDPVFWRSVDGTTSGPLNFYALLPLHWLGLSLDYFTGRLTGLMLIWGALFASYRTLASRFGRVPAWLGILPAAGFFATVTCNDFTHYSSECVTLLLIALAIWFLASREKNDTRHVCSACFIAGCAVWAKLQAAPLGAILVGWGIWQGLEDTSTPNKIRWKHAAQAALAAITPSLLAIAVIVATGQVEAAYRRYFLNNLLYVGTARPFHDAFRDMAVLAAADGRLPWLLATAFAVLAATTLHLLVRHRRPSALFVAGALLTLAAIVAIITPRREFLHYTLLLIIPLTFWIGSALGGWWQDLSSASHRRWFVGLVFLFTGLPLLLTRCLQPVPNIYGDFAYHWRHPRGSVAEVINALAEKKGSLGVWGWASYLYVETGLPQATRDAHSVWSIEANKQRDYHRACYLADLRHSEPAVFVDAVGSEIFGYTNRINSAHETFPELAEYIHSNYVLVTDLGEARIYARRGLTTLHALTPARIAELTSHRRPSNLIAPSITALEHFQKKIINQKNVIMLLPPTKIEWQLEGDMREAIIGFGFDPFAYENGKSNGVELIMELVDHEQIRPLYRYFLDPTGKADDRHPQTAVITLPPFAPGARLVLRTDPGPYGDSAWDWIYLDNLQLKRSPRFISNQFPGFNHMPDSVDSNNSLIDPSGRILLPAPSSLTFLLAGNEGHLGFDYGFQPGAYSNGGNTDGAIFRIELMRSGQSARTIFERYLRPLEQVEDRGVQKADVTLTETHPDDYLKLSIEPGPAGNASWDWTFVSNLVLE